MEGLRRQMVSLDEREVTMTNGDVHGPIDFVLVEFPGDRMTGGAAEALVDLVEAGTIRIYDLLVVRKEQDGSFSGFDVADLPGGAGGGFVAFTGARSGLLGDDDLKQAADVMDPGTMAALIVYENTWAIPFVSRAMEAGAQLIASARIPADVVNEALDELEAQDAG
jgi:hypothetical protein